MAPVWPDDVRRHVIAILEHVDAIDRHIHGNIRILVGRSQKIGHASSPPGDLGTGVRGPGHPVTLKIGMGKQPQRQVGPVVVIGACGWFNQ